MDACVLDVLAVGQSQSPDQLTLSNGQSSSSTNPRHHPRQYMDAIELCVSPVDPQPSFHLCHL
jgi:hypothetical protein